MEHQTDRHLGTRAIAGSTFFLCFGRSAMRRTLVACQILAVALIVCIAGNGQAQVMGEEAELDRLRAKAEDAMGNDDAETAAMSMGRAALMAAQLDRPSTRRSTSTGRRNMDIGRSPCFGEPAGNSPLQPASAAVFNWHNSNCAMRRKLSAGRMIRRGRTPPPLDGRRRSRVWKTGRLCWIRYKGNFAAPPSPDYS